MRGAVVVVKPEASFERIEVVGPKIRICS